MTCAKQACPANVDKLASALTPYAGLRLLAHIGPPGHHADGGCSAEILVGRSATRWLRLYGRPYSRVQSRHRLERSRSSIAFGRRTMLSGTV